MMRLTTASYVASLRNGLGSWLTLFDSPQSTEFEIDREYVGRVVGSGGTQINKIRDSLGVVIHFDQESEWTRETSKKKREKVPQKSRVKVGARSPIR